MKSSWIIVCFCSVFVQAQNPGPFFQGGFNPFRQSIEETEVYGDEIPGVAGVDYPVFAEAPPTSFSCDNWPVPGYYADPDSGCQVYYVCEESGRGRPFLCPNGTIFHQEHLVCEWWYNFDCSRAVQLYGVNEDVVREMNAVDANNPLSKTGSPRAQAARLRQLNSAPKQRQLNLAKTSGFPAANRGFGPSSPFTPSGLAGPSNAFSSGQASPSGFNGPSNFEGLSPVGVRPGSSSPFTPGRSRGPSDAGRSLGYPQNYPSSPGFPPATSYGTPFTNTGTTPFNGPAVPGYSYQSPNVNNIFDRSRNQNPFQNNFPAVSPANRFGSRGPASQNNRGDFESGYSYPAPNPSFNFDRDSNFSPPDNSYLPPSS